MIYLLKVKNYVYNKLGQGNRALKFSAIADAVSNIVSSKNPKTRYRIGKWAKPMVWLRVYLGDRLFDRIVLNQI